MSPFVIVNEKLEVATLGAPYDTASPVPLAPIIHGPLAATSYLLTITCVTRPSTHQNVPCSDVDWPHVLPQGNVTG